jgi:multicomponent Na+:H+ antiporter subunit C
VTAWQLYTLSGIAWFGIGLWGVFVQPHWVRKILAANVAGSGLFLVFIAIARRAINGPDPVPHALVLTGIVVSVSATALALAVARRLAELDIAAREQELAGDSADPDLEESPP